MFKKIMWVGFIIYLFSLAGAVVLRMYPSFEQQFLDIPEIALLLQFFKEETSLRILCGLIIVFGPYLVLGLLFRFFFKGVSIKIVINGQQDDDENEDEDDDDESDDFDDDEDEDFDEDEDEDFDDDDDEDEEDEDDEVEDSKLKKCYAGNWYQI